jgi:serine/threonine protein kinase
MTQPADPLIGQTLKHYFIESLIGHGGMGIVFKARDTRLERPVALKILKPDLVADPQRKSRFLMEARSAAALTHPAIAQVYDIDESGETTFIAMEYIDGRTVTCLIANGELDLLGSVEIAYQVAEGLARAHEAGILHRDIKSDNIMVTRDGHAKLLDFGLAKLLESEAEPPAGQGSLGRTLTMGRQAHTLAGTVIGTVPYMSPEQARGQALDARSDIFSFGVVLYEMITGKRPFKGESLLDTMHSIAFEEAKPVTIVRRNLPPQIHRIVARCLRKQREDRYPDARVLASELKHLKTDLESGTRLTLPPMERFMGWLDRLKAAFPYGTPGLLILTAALLLTTVFLFTKISWGNLIGPATIVFFVYRSFKTRKKRSISAMVKKISDFPEVKAIFTQNDLVTVVLDKAPAKTYIKITGLLESANRRLYFTKPIEVVLKDDLPEIEFQNRLRTPGIVYARNDIAVEPRSKKKTSTP